MIFCQATAAPWPAPPASWEVSAPRRLRVIRQASRTLPASNSASTRTRAKIWFSIDRGANFNNCATASESPVAAKRAIRKATSARPSPPAWSPPSSMGGSAVEINRRRRNDCIVGEVVYMGRRGNSCITSAFGVPAHMALPKPPSTLFNKPMADTFAWPRAVTWIPLVSSTLVSGFFSESDVEPDTVAAAAAASGCCHRGDPWGRNDRGACTGRRARSRNCASFKALPVLGSRRSRRVLGGCAAFDAAPAASAGALTTDGLLLAGGGPTVTLGNS